MKKLAVYGTLRRGGRLNYYLGDEAEYRGSQWLTGYVMKSLGGYPFVMKGDGKILVEIWEVPQEEYERTSSMEKSAGYDMQEVETELGKAELYYMGEKELTGDYSYRYVDAPVVESGDWIKYSERRHARL